MSSVCGTVLRAVISEEDRRDIYRAKKAEKQRENYRTDTAYRRKVLAAMKKRNENRSWWVLSFDVRGVYPQLSFPPEMTDDQLKIEVLLRKPQLGKNKTALVWDRNTGGGVSEVQWKDYVSWLREHEAQMVAQILKKKDELAGETEPADQRISNRENNSSSSVKTTKRDNSLASTVIRIDDDEDDDDDVKEEVPPCPPSPTTLLTAKRSDIVRRVEEFLGERNQTKKTIQVKTEPLLPPLVIQESPPSSPLLHHPRQTKTLSTQYAEKIDLTQPSVKTKQEATEEEEEEEDDDLLEVVEDSEPEELLELKNLPTPELKRSTGHYTPHPVHPKKQQCLKKMKTKTPQYKIQKKKGVYLPPAQLKPLQNDSVLEGYQPPGLSATYPRSSLEEALVFSQPKEESTLKLYSRKRKVCK
jgi:hypothetical protein